MKTYSLRKAYGDGLIALAKENPHIIALDADLGKSTFARAITQVNPKQYVEMGIAEQNMASVSAGLALSGKVPFFSSFAVFATGRAYDQIRSSICIPNLNVNICGSSAGLSDYGDGKTHQSIDDLALMQVLPHMHVFTPLDANQTKAMVQAMAEIDGPCYIRIPRNDLPMLTEKVPYSLGQVDVLQEGKDILLISCGGITHNVLAAAQNLKEQGISAMVSHIGTIKPFPSEIVQDLASGIPRVLIVEEHNTIGGLGSAVAKALISHKESTPRTPTFDHMGIEDSFGQSAENYEVLINHYGLSVEHIIKRALRMISTS